MVNKLFFIIIIGIIAIQIRTEISIFIFAIITVVYMLYEASKTPPTVGKEL